MEQFKSKLDELQNDRILLDQIFDRLCNDNNLLKKDPLSVNKPHIEVQNEEVLSIGKEAVPVLIEKYKEIPYEDYGVGLFKPWLIQLLSQFKQADTFVLQEMDDVLSLKEKGLYQHNYSIIACALIGLSQRAVRNDSQKLMNIWWQYFKQYWEAFVQVQTLDNSFHKYNSYYFYWNVGRLKIIELIERENSQNPVDWVSDVLGQLKKS